MPGQIDRLDKASAIELAKRMRSRARNAALKTDELMKHVATAGGAVGGAYLLGHIMGGKEHEYTMNATAIDAGQAEDPRQVMGMDIELVVGLGATVTGLAMQGLIGKKGKAAGTLASAIEGVGVGALASYAYTAGADMGRKAAEEAPAAA